MSTDRFTKSLLILIAGMLGVIALRPSTPSALAAPESPPAAPNNLAKLQVSAAPGGFLAFDSETGEVLQVSTGENAAVALLGTLRKKNDGKWEFTSGQAEAKGEAARTLAAGADLALLMAALKSYRIDTGRFPSTEEGLQALVVQPPGADNWKGPYLKGQVPKDPWGNPYLYRSPGKQNTDSVDVLSFGPDRREGGGDDIVNR